MCCLIPLWRRFSTVGVFVLLVFGAMQIGVIADDENENENNQYFEELFHNDSLVRLRQLYLLRHRSKAGAQFLMLATGQPLP